MYYYYYYYYFEAFTKEIKTIPQNDRVAFTQKYQHHQPSGFCYKIVGQNIKRCVLFRATENEDVSRKFVEMLEEDIKNIFKQFNFSKKMLPLTTQEQTEFIKAKICWICQKRFNEKDKKSEIMTILLENFVGRLIIHVISNSKNQNLLQLFFIIFQDMMHIYLSKIWGCPREILNVSQTMKKNTLVSAKKSLLILMKKMEKKWKYNMK